MAIQTRRILWSFALLGTFSCDRSAGRASLHVAATIPCAAFPGSLFPDSGLRRKEIWYGKHFRAFGVSSLCPTSSKSTEAYRFVWLRSFHRPVLVLVERTNDRTTLRAEELSGAGGYDPGHIVADTTFALSDEQWASVTQAVDAASFWNPHAVPADSLSGLDGAQWIVEGVRSGRYRAEDVWTPQTRTEYAAFRQLGIRLLRAAGRLPGDAEVY